MGTSPISRSMHGTGRRLGRPPAKIKKVTRSVRIPPDVDAFLTDYSQEHGLLIGDVITEAVLRFRTKLTELSERHESNRVASAT